MEAKKKHVLSIGNHLKYDLMVEFIKKRSKES